MARDKIAHILSLIPKGRVYAKAVHFAKNRPGKQFGPIRLGKELGIKPEHAKLVGARLVRDGHVKHGKFKGQPTFIPKAGGKGDSQDSIGLQSDLGGRQESQQTEPQLRAGEEKIGGSRDVKSDGPERIEVAAIEPGTPEPVDGKQPEMPSIDRASMKDLLEHPLGKKAMQTLAASGIKGTPTEIGVRLMLEGRHNDLGLSSDEAEELGAHFLGLV